MDTTQISKYPYRVLALYFLFIVFLFKGLFNNAELVMLDYYHIIQPLESIESFSLYFQMLFSGSIYDFQPIRDLSHLIDLFIENSLKIVHFGLYTNLVLFYLCSIAVFRFARFHLSNNKSLLLAILFLSHPIFMTIISEPTQRKHILSFLFTLLFLISIQQKKYVRSYFAYALALFSHPINLLAPLYFVIKERNILFSKKYKEMKHHGGFLLLAVLASGLNLYYYSFAHAEKTGAAINPAKMDPNILVHTFGIYAQQFFYPSYISPYYELVTPKALLFFGVLLLFLFICFKKDRILSSLLVSLYIGVMIMLYAIPSNVYSFYVTNSYFLTPLFVLAFLFVFIINVTGWRRFVIPPIIMMLLFFSYKELASKTDKYSYYKSKLTQESHCKILQYVIAKAIGIGEVETFQKHGPEWLDQRCLITFKGHEYTRTFINIHLILVNEKFSFEEKKELINLRFISNSDRSLLQAGLNIISNQNEKQIDQNLMALQNENDASIFMQQSYIGKELIRNYCSNNQGEGCITYKEYSKRTKGKDAILTIKKLR